MRVLHLLGAAGPTSIPAQWAKLQQSTGHDVRCVEFESNRITAAWIRVFRVIRAFRADVIHAHIVHGVLSGLLFGFVFRVPLVVHLHRSYAHLGLLSRLGYRLGMFFSAGVIVNSFATYRSLPELIRKNKKTSVIYNGVDLSELQGITGGQVGFANPVKLVTVCRLIAEKNLAALVKAVHALNQRKANTKFQLRIVGDGPMRTQLELLVTELGCQEFVEFTGMLPRAQVYDELNSADVFLMCSITEGYCNALVEAMALGVPSLVTPGGALPEVLGDGGWIIGGFEHADISTAVQQFVGVASEEISARTEFAKARALKMSMRSSVKKLISAYELSVSGGAHEPDVFEQSCSR